MVNCTNTLGYDERGFRADAAVLKIVHKMRLHWLYEPKKGFVKNC
jgi:hypothetical protein